jgi:long-chain acyl-CoA synthetase
MRQRRRRRRCAKEYGIWQTWSWRARLDDAPHGLGLASLGFAKGQNLAIIGDNRPLLYLMFLAVQSLGGVPVPLYQDAVAAEMAFVMRGRERSSPSPRTRSRWTSCWSARASPLPPSHIIYDDPRGLRNYASRPDQHRGADGGGPRIEQQHPDFFEQAIAASARRHGHHPLHLGHHRQAQGRVPDAPRLIAAAAAACHRRPDRQDNVLSYLPPAWVGDHLFSLAQWLVAGFTINCPESAETVMIDLREIGPTYYFAPPRVFEAC